MFNTVRILMNRRTDGTREIFGSIQVGPYKFGDPLEELPTTFKIEAGTPTRVAESIWKIATMEDLHDADGNTWPEGERQLAIGDVLIITDEQDRVTKNYARGAYGWRHLHENEMPYPEPA